MSFLWNDEFDADNVQKKLDEIRVKIQSRELPAQADAMESAYERESGILIMEYFFDYAGSLADNVDAQIAFLEQLMGTVDLYGQMNEIPFRGDLAYAYARKGNREKYEAICQDILARYPDTQDSLNCYWNALLQDNRTKEVYDAAKPLVEKWADEPGKTDLVYERFREAAMELGLNDEAKAAMEKQPKEECPYKDFNFEAVDLGLDAAPVLKAKPVVPEPKAVPIKAAPKVGRNDPCPCGSGKKYKKCCGMNA